MFQVRVITPAYLLTGQVEEAHSFLGWLNNKDKATLDLHNVEALVLDPKASIPATATKLATVHKSQVVAIDLFSSEAQRTVQVAGRAELSVLYTARFIIQANLHPTGDMPISRIPDVVKSNFVAITQARLHPLLATRQLPALESPVMILNWHYVDFYHGR